MNPSRRQFIKRIALSASSLSLMSHLPLRLALARQQRPQTNSTPFFVMIYMSGGWDVSLSLDPWLDSKQPDPKDLFIEYRPEDVFRDQTIALGPAASPLEKHSDQIAIVNGILMSEFDQGHATPEAYLRTGSETRSLPDLSIALADRFQPGPLGVLCQSSLLRANSKTLTTRVDSLKQGPSPHASLIEQVLESNEDSMLLDETLEKIVQANPILRSIQDSLEKTAQEELNGDFQALEDHHLVGEAFRRGATYQAELTLNLSLDTHSQHEKTHLTNQRKGWETVSKFFDYFQSIPWGKSGESLFDHTTFMVASEFSRTPALNASMGKDHYPGLNSVLLAGNGIQPRTCLGGSHLIPAKVSKTDTSQHWAMPLDFATGDVATSRLNAKFIRPEHITKAVMLAQGVPKDRLPKALQEVATLPRLLV